MLAENSESLPRIYVVGAPGAVGGADTELWHTLRLWRSRDLPVTVVPTWKLNTAWRARCEAIGCQVSEPQRPGALLDVPGIRSGVVVSFCNGHFLDHAGRFREAGCRVVWVNCMTWLFPAERKHYDHFGLFDHYVFQSRHQERALTAKLAGYGYRPGQGTVIRGAFCLDEFPFRPRPHAAREPLRIGRISRPDADKYSSNTWPIYARIPHPIRARLMAWSPQIEEKLGPPPPWAECLPVNAEPAAEFFAKLHAMVQVNGGAGENWPRSGLEAMATGVPVVVQNLWGWREMIRHGRTGFLCDDDDQIAYYTARLAYDEDLRLAVAANARRALEEEHADSDRLWSQWCGVFAHLAEHRTPITVSPNNDPL